MAHSYRGKLLEFGESVLAHLPEVGKGSGNPAPKLGQMEIRRAAGQERPHGPTDEGVVCARSVRRLACHSWSEENLRAVVETPQKSKTTTADIPPAAEPLAPPPGAPEVPEDDSRTRGRRRNAGEAVGHKRDTRSVELKQRREGHRNTRECVCEETVVVEVTDAAGHTCHTF